MNSHSAKLPRALPITPRVFHRRQVAAVCYRLRKRGPEFLLVQTRSGRWIFPKGGVEPGLSPAHSAALEALEEAGVHGRIEEIPFTIYSRNKSESASRQPDTSGPPANSVGAYLCEVLRLERPQERGRRPTWFSAERAKRRLREDRTPDFADELARVVDRAVSRILRSRDVRQNSHSWSADELQKVRFEAAEILRAHAPGKEIILQSRLRRIHHSPDNHARLPVLHLVAAATPPAPGNHPIASIDTERRRIRFESAEVSARKRRTRKD